MTEKLNNLMDLYADFLACNFGQASATAMSNMLDGEVSHDRFSRLLSRNEFTSRELWLKAKPLVREIESADGVLIIDDTIEKKPSTDENEIVCWHHDHTTGQSVKGINILTAVYHSQSISVPIAYEIVKKDVVVESPQTGKEQRKSSITKNELMRDIIKTAVHNQLLLKYVLTDSWFSAKENLSFIRSQGKHFICALKSNRLFTPNQLAKSRGEYQAVSELELTDKQAIQGYLRGYQEPILVVRLTFTNKDGSIGLLNLVTSDLSLTGQQVFEIYQKRWKIEEFHKSLKSNLGLEKSPTQTIKTQSNHIFMTMLAFLKLESLKIAHGSNHFALKAKIYIKSLQAAYHELKNLKLALPQNSSA